MLKEIRHDGSFVATDEDGHKYVINMYTEIRTAGSFGDPHATIEGQKSLQTDSGDWVTYLKKRKYRIVQTGVVISTDDPNAP